MTSVAERCGVATHTLKSWILKLGARLLDLEQLYRHRERHALSDAPPSGLLHRWAAVVVELCRRLGSDSRRQITDLSAVRELATGGRGSYADAAMSSTPHDAVFKAVFGQPEHARGTLRAVVPPVLAEALDWQTLTLRPGSFVDAALMHQHTDLLYSARWCNGGEALVYFLFEHQSTPPTEGLMAFRLLRYQDRIWERWRVDHPKAKTLPDDHPGRHVSRRDAVVGAPSVRPPARRPARPTARG